MPVWTIDGVFRAAYGQLRAQPVAVLVALGFIPEIWNLPGNWAMTDGAAWLVKQGQSELASTVGANVFAALWHSIVVGGSVLVALDVARGLNVNLTRYRDGLRVIPPMFAIWSTLYVGLELMVASSWSPRTRNGFSACRRMPWCSVRRWSLS